MQNKLKNLILATAVLVSMVGCQKSITVDTQPTSTPAATLLNVSYGSDALQTMDIYLPAGRTVDTTKVIIMIHGGGWSSGDKSDFNSYVDTLKRRMPSYAIFNINYRLSNGGVNTFPTQETDVKAAVDLIVFKANDYLVSQKVILLGASAGGHLALLQGYKYSSPKVKAVVDFFGPTDMTDLYNNPASPFVPSSAVAAVVGATPTSNPVLYRQSSPINFVDAQSPPTIIFQGGADPLVSVSQSSSLQARLQANSVLNQYQLYPTEGHGWVGANLVDSFDKLQLFLTTNVH
jgi:acetyl esterase/lipase